MIIQTNLPKTVPFFKPLFFLLIGIVTVFYFEDFFLNYSVKFGLLIAIIVSVIVFIYIKNTIKKNYLKGIAICLIYYLFGMGLLTINISKSNTNYFTQKNAKYLAVYLPDNLTETKKCYKGNAIIEYIIDEKTNPQNAIGNVLVYFQKSDFNTINHHQIIFIPNNLTKLSTNIFPDGFNYKQIMSQHNIEHAIFLKKGDFILTNQHKKNIFYYAINCKNYLKKYIEHIIPEKRIAGLFQSLLLGDKENVLDDDIKNFKNSGTLHILAVSGMHVILIFSVLFFILKKTFKKIKTIYIVLIGLVAIWIFVFVTGISASVLRAGIMCSISEIGKLYFRNKGNSYNFLCASAFIQLCLNPLQFLNIGFQLSYAAVLGILFFYKPVLSCLPIKNKFLLSIWKLCAVSIAATLATFPLSLYYFGQFPVWFLLGNLLLVPLSSFIIVFGIAAIIVVKIPILGSVFIYVLIGCIKLMNYLNEIISNLPFSIISNIKIGKLVLISVYVFIIGFGCFLFNNKTYSKLIALRVTGLVLIIFSALTAVNQIFCYNTNKEFVYLNGKKEYAFVVKNKTMIINTNDIYIAHDKFIIAQLKEYAQMHHIKCIRILPLSDNNLRAPIK